MAYNKRYKKSSYKSNSYGYNQPTGSYAYHDIDEHHDWIKYMMDVHGLSNYRYISVSDDVKESDYNQQGEGWSFTTKEEEKTSPLSELMDYIDDSEVR